MSRGSRPPGVRAGMAAAAVAVLLAGCGGARTPSAPDDAGQHTVVTPRQAIMITAAVDAALVRAATAKDAGAAGERAIGPARESLAASIVVATAAKQPVTAPAGPNRPRLLLTRAEAWPRWFVVAGPTAASATPVVRVLHSQEARRPYGLWGQLQLLPGATLPETASATVGLVPAGADAKGYLRTPGEVLTRYVDVLNRGTGSTYAADYAPDAYRAELAQQLAADRKLVAAARAGEFTTRHTLVKDAMFVLPTRDGGALVIGRVDQLYQLSVTPGRGAVRLDAPLAALARRQVVTKRLQRRSIELLAFHVPRAGSRDRVTLVAASRTDVAATGS